MPNAYVVGCPDNVATPGWTLRGKPVPRLTAAQAQATADRIPVHAPSAEIAVERIRGPILLTCGGDQIWPSCALTIDIVAWLRLHHFAVNATELAWADNTQHPLALLAAQP